MIRSWGWMPPRADGIWRYGPSWLRVFSAAVPWITLGVIGLMFHVASGVLCGSQGVRFELPVSGIDDMATASLVALVMPSDGRTLVYFDDVRYSFGETSSEVAFGDHLTDRVAGAADRSLLLLVDRRVPSGDLMGVVAAARNAGVARVLVAARREEIEEE